MLHVSAGLTLTGALQHAVLMQLTSWLATVLIFKLSVICKKFEFGSLYYQERYLNNLLINNSFNSCKKLHCNK